MKLVRKINHIAERPNTTNACCFFDGLRILFTREPSTDRLGGEAEVVSLDFCFED